jgi:L-lactate dehydrogenase
MKKIIVIGFGNVGKNYVNYLVNEVDASYDIGIIDKDRDTALGNIMDLNHELVLNNKNSKVKMSEYDDCFNADIVVITAGVKQKVDQTRAELLKDNTIIIKDITNRVVESGFNGIFIVATNPVDIMSYLVRKVSNFPSNKVIGTGTMVDTARLKYLLGNKINVNPNNIHAYVLGEHSNTCFSVWSKASIGMVKVSSKVEEEDLDAIMIETKSIPFKIIKYKNETSYLVAMSLVKITKAIVHDENVILTVSSLYDNVYVSMPFIIGKNGVKGVMKLDFTQEEEDNLTKSINGIKENIRKMEELL